MMQPQAPMQPQMQPGMQPMMQPGMQPMMQPGMQPMMQPGMQPQMQPGMMPAMPPPLGFATHPTRGEWNCCYEFEGPCCGNGCMSYNMYLMDADLNQNHAKVHYNSNCCHTEVQMRSVPLYGGNVDFALHRPLCCTCCIETTMDVTENGRTIGTLVNHPRLCWHFCSPFTAVEAKTADGQVRIQRMEPCCYDGRGITPTATCRDREITWPLYMAPVNPRAPSVYLRYGFDLCCPLCYPEWVGYREWPQSVQSRDDNVLLMAMALMRWSNMQQGKQDEENSGNGGGGGGFMAA